jgi:transcriptional regulator with XRE-family HTH domain
MDDARIGRTILVLRQRRGWRQTDLAARAGVSPSAISSIERGKVDRYTLTVIRRVLKALDGSTELDVRWHGRGDLDRLLDADHARLVDGWTERQPAGGWETWNEASFSIYGERGPIDLLAFHAATGILEVAECKTGLWDQQETLGLLDVKVRLAPRVAGDRGWRVKAVVPALVLADGRTVRRRVGEHPSLFGRFSTRGRSAHAWVRSPWPGVAGLLVFVPLPKSNDRGLRRAGQQRVRVPASKSTEIPLEERRLAPRSPVEPA